MSICSSRPHPHPGHAPSPARSALLTDGGTLPQAERSPRVVAVRAVAAVVATSPLLLAQLTGAVDGPAILVVAVILAAAVGGTPAGAALAVLATLDILLVPRHTSSGAGLAHLVRDAATSALFCIALALVAYARIQGRQGAQGDIAWLRHHAFHDGLTGLPNRLLLHDRLAQALREARRADAPVAVLLIDLDRFKEVNDTWGHAAGDEVLAAVGQRLRAAVRDGDTVGRLGGDEFAAILPRTGEHGATRVAAAVRAALAAPLRIEGHVLDIGASVGVAVHGVAVHPDQAGDASALFEGADASLYRAKRRCGR